MERCDNRIGYRIKTFREKKKLNQTEFANELRCARTTIACIETAQRLPSMRVIDDICNTYNLNKEWLCFGKGEMELEEDKITTINELVGIFNKLDNDEQKAIMSMMKTIVEKKK